MEIPQKAENKSNTRVQFHSFSGAGEFYVNSTQIRVILKEGNLTEKLFPEDPIVRHFFKLVIDGGKGGTIPG